VPISEIYMLSSQLWRSIHIVKLKAVFVVSNKNTKFKNNFNLV